MSFLFKHESAQRAIWEAAFAAALPELEFRAWPEYGAPEEIRYLLFYKPIENLQPFTNLELVFTTSAGADQALKLDLPAHVKLVRMIEPALTGGMVEYVVGSVLMQHRHMPAYLNAQAQLRWAPLDVPLPGARRIGIMGAGVLGLACLEALRPFGFPLSVWSRTAKALPGVSAFAGPDELPAFLAQTDILICLLPLTPATTGILNQSLFAALPRGASLIHVGRGGHLVETDLLAALEDGQLSHAILDVLPREPLPETSPLWAHPQIWITPHIASDTQAQSGAVAVIENLKRHFAGQAMIGEVDRQTGY